MSGGAMRRSANQPEKSALLHSIDQEEEVIRTTHHSVQSRGALIDPPDGFQIVKEDADLGEPDENDSSLVLCIYIAHYALRHMPDGRLQDCRCVKYRGGPEFDWLHQRARQRLTQSERPPRSTAA